MTQALTIGQLARTTGVPSKTIRYYEQVGVLPPPDRTPAGDRQDARRGVPRLLFLPRARALALSLPPLHTLAAALVCAALRAARSRRADVVAGLPPGHLLDSVGRRPFMTCGLLVIALCDVARVMTSAYGVFLGLRALAGVGWAMFGTAATTTIVDGRASSRRGRVVSLLFMSETLGLFLGSLGGGWLYQGVGAASPFRLQVARMPVASVGRAPA